MVGRHAAGRRRAAVTALSALALTAVHSAAVAQPPSAPAPVLSAARTAGTATPSPEMLRALGRDLRLTPGQVTTRLANEAEAGTRAGRLHNALGSRFAGAWVSGATSADLNVATTDAADVPAIQAEGAKAAIVRTSLRGLQSLQDRLDDAAGRTRTADTPVWYVDVRTNRVVVQATSRSAATSFIRAAGVEDRGLAVRVSAERPALREDIVGGDAYYINDAARCSVGFSVTKGQQQGFVSAGHCGTAGDTTTGFNQAAQGTFQASTFPGKDMSWVGVNSDWTVTPTVRGEGGQSVQVAGSVQALVGASVCRSGSTTGWHCGTIQQLNTSVTYEEGTVNGLTRTTVCAEPGDSGGPYLAGAQAQGVTSGGSGDCTRGGTTFFQPVNPILSDFGLTLTTAAATAAPEQSGTTGTWAAGRVYAVGDTVTVEGVSYQCLQTHQAQTTWAPDSTPALWQRV